MCALHLSHASPSVCAHACTRAQSVANTAKRALLIMLSVWYFGNPVTVWNAVGMATVVLGSTELTYQGREYDLGRPFRRMTLTEAVLHFNPTLVGEQPSQIQAGDYQLTVTDAAGATSTATSTSSAPLSSSTLPSQR